MLDKFEGNVSANPNATDEAKQEATDADAEVDVNGQPEATTPSSSGTTDNSGSASTGNSGAGSSNTGGSGSSSQPSQPAHQHVWKNHTATKRVWVEKWVTVPDYETQTIKGAQLYTKHSDGQWYSDGVVYWFENGFTTSDLKTIIKDKVKNEGYIGNYVNRTKTERVQVGSHKEDEGHYENKTYVDYQYCDCGAKK